MDDARAFAAFWSVMRAPIVGGGDAACRTPLHALVDASERHASGVCRSLRDGVLAASTDVLGALVGRRRIDVAARLLDDTFEQALTIVYRMLFLLFAEARGLVPLWHPVYRESYSLEALRTTPRNGRARRPGLWDALRAIARLAHAGCRAGDLRVTPFNGRLFAPGADAARRAPRPGRRGGAARGAGAVDAAVGRPRGRERIAYRDLGVEQLGAVYETLLDYEPRVDAARPRRTGRRPRRARAEPAPACAKATGTFYTPQPIADYLVRRTLGPLVRDAAPERILQLRVVDPAMGSGAFLVAACRYLASAYETALVQRGGCHASDIGEAERAAIRRTIAERCLYGVDLNPMAVQLARLSLWLATLAADRPLTFLDHHLQAGDSLLGAWLTSLRRPPPPAPAAADRRTLPLFDDAGARDAATRACRFASRSSRSRTTRSSRCARRSARSRRSIGATARSRNGSGSPICGARRGSRPTRRCRRQRSAHCRTRF